MFGILYCILAAQKGEIILKNYYNFLKKRLFFIYIVYIVIFSILAYSAYAMYSRNNFMKYEQHRSSEIMHKIENYIENSMSTANILSNDSVVSEFSQAASDNNASALNEVCKKISSVGFIDNMNYYMGLVNIEKDRVVMPLGSVSYQYFLSRFNLDESTFTDSIQELYNLNTNSRKICISLSNESEYNQTGFIVSIISCKTKLDNPNIFIFLYDVKSFFSDLPHVSIDSIIEIDFPKYNAHISYNEHSGAISNTVNAKHLKKTVSAHTTSNYYGDIYCTLYVPYFSYIIHLNNFLILFLLLLLALAFVFLIIANSSINNLYLPVKNLIKGLPSGEFNENTDEFEAIQSYITSLLKQKDIMSEIISKSQHEQIDKFLLQLMTQTLTNIQIKEGIVTHKLNNVDFPLVCFIITYRNYQELNDMFTSEALNDIHISINEILDANLSSAKYFKIIDLDVQTTLCISHIDDSEIFVNRLKKVALNIEMLLDINLIIYLGEKASSWFDVSQSYNSALSLKNNLAILSDNSMVISAESVSCNGVQRTIKYPTEFENNLLNAVLAMDANKSMEYINGIIDINMSGNMFIRDYYFQFVIMLYATVTKLLAAIGKTEKEVFNDVKIYLELVECSNTQELKAKMAYFINLIISSKAIMQKNADDASAKRIIDYINKNYANDISLFTLADYLNVSQSYASKIFKMQMGENFKDYLTNFRLNKAVEIMKNNPYMKIGEIAKQVGYTSFNFTRVFTQKYGMTPSNYIRK